MFELNKEEYDSVLRSQKCDLTTRTLFQILTRPLAGKAG
ncbi:hypothetical protein [Sphingobacterium sp. SGR-19]|nr:hypothetical protein [Sphingobacterium sp. SGR-19]